MSETEFAPELPQGLILELGYFASDWSRIEQNILCHVIMMSRGTVADNPSGFSRLRRHWFKLCRDHLQTSDFAEVEKLNDRLHRRSVARNYALHGTWVETTPDHFNVVLITRCDNGSYRRENLMTTYSEVRDQTALLRDMRCDLADFLNRVF